MKKIKILFLLFFLTALTACGQQKKYVSYTVKKGETIKSIAKDNGVKTRDLLRLNPDVSRKPEANTVIIIPNKTKKTVVTTGTSKEKTHTVKKKETLFSISQKYDVGLSELKKINNIIGDNVSIGRELKIPLKKKGESVETLIEKEDEVVVLESITHTVEKGDTVFNLTKRYNITEEELKILNPTLKGTELPLGMILKVGEKLEKEVETIFIDEITEKTLNIVLMLPYKLNASTDYQAQFKKKTSLLNIVTDFHSGVLMAIDSLENQGLKVHLKVFDTENDTQKIASILAENNFDDVTAIIGPLFLKNAKKVSDKTNNIPVIAPMFSKKQTLISRGNLVKVSPNKQLLEDKLVNYLLDNYSGENIVIIGDASVKSAAKISSISAKLKTHDSIHKITIIKPEEGYIKKDRFIESIKVNGQNNWVLLIGKDNVTTNDVVNNLGVISKKDAKIQLFSFDNDTNFYNVSNNLLGRLHFTYPKEEFIDNLSDETKVFQKKYRSKYYKFPSKYAVKGFDVTYDTLLRLANFDSFKEATKAGVSQRIGTRFEYTKKLFGSTENEGVFLIQYQENLKLKVLD